MNESSLELFPGMCLGIAETKKKLDQHTLLKNPNLIVNDSVKLACDNLWQTLTQKVISKYSLGSVQMKLILNWIHMNIHFLSQIINGTSETSNI